MSLFVRIKALKHSLSRNEQKLANFTLESPSAIRDLSSPALADVVGISQSSVVKFAQKLGFRGYPAFKLAVIEAFSAEQVNAPIHGQISLHDSFDSMADKLLFSKHNVLQETRHLNDVVQIERAVKLLKSASRIVLCGLGGSGLVCKDFGYKLQKLGMSAFAESDSHVQMALAAACDDRDVIIAISESGSTSEVLKVAERGKATGTPVITITRYGVNPLSRLAEVTLFSGTDETTARLSSMLSRLAQEHVVDMLFIALTQAYPQGRQRLATTNEVVNAFKANA